jgi:glycosyltransferase involved in cell wall biosynthesis
MEGIPVALMEALACRLPVIATSLSGIPELVRPNTTGYLVPPADAPALADALAAVYADPEGADQLAERGRAVVLKEFELQTNVARLAALVEGTVQDRQRR